MLKGVCKRSTIKRRIAVAVCALALTVGMAPSALQDAQAAMVTFSLDVLFGDGPVLPSGTLVATFDDGGTAGSVTLTMDATALSGSSEKITGWWFNTSVDPTTIDTFVFTWLSGPEAFPPIAAESNPTDNNPFRPGPDGLFDIFFDFPQNENQSANHMPPLQGVFDAGDVSTYSITGTGIMASTFNLFRQSDGPAGPFLSAAKVQGIYIPPGTTDGSAWVGAVPIPATVWLMGSGLVALGAFARRRRLRITARPPE